MDKGAWHNHCDGVGGEVSTQEQLYQNCWAEHDRAPGSVAGAVNSDCSCFWLDSSQKKTCRANSRRSGKCPYNPSVKIRSEERRVGKEG